jgi:hypothetical protein
LERSNGASACTQSQWRKLGGALQLGTESRYRAAHKLQAFRQEVLIGTCWEVCVVERKDLAVLLRRDIRS